MPPALRRFFGRVGLGILYVGMVALLLVCLSKGVADVRDWTAPRHWGVFTTEEQSCSSGSAAAVCDLKGHWESDDGQINLDHATLTAPPDTSRDGIRSYYQPQGADNEGSQDVHRGSERYQTLVLSWGFSALLGWFVSMPVRDWVRRRRALPAAHEDHQNDQRPPAAEPTEGKGGQRPSSPPDEQ